MFDGLMLLLQHYGAAGLFVLAFLESFIFPVPPEIIFVPLALTNRDAVLFYAFLTTAASVLGAVPGYFIGLYGGRPLAVRFFGAERIALMEKLMQKYDTPVIAAAGFSPLPYKLITISCGVFKVPLKDLLLWSVVSRAARFFLEGVLILTLGQTAVDFITGRGFLYLTAALTAAAAVIWLIRRKRKRAR